CVWLSPKWMSSSTNGEKGSGKTPRCDGPNHTLKDFPAFCPKAFAGIGELPDTTADRSIRIAMARRQRAQAIERFRAREAGLASKPIAGMEQLHIHPPEPRKHLRISRITFAFALIDGSHLARISDDDL